MMAIAFGSWSGWRGTAMVGTLDRLQGIDPKKR